MLIWPNGPLDDAALALLWNLDLAIVAELEQLLAPLAAKCLQREHVADPGCGQLVLGDLRFQRNEVLGQDSN